MWYNSAMTYDMVTAGPWNNMNLHMNQLYDHSAVWNNMFQYPQYNFGNCMPYGDGFGFNSFMTNPMYTIGQMSWGTPMWNNFGNMWGGGNMWNTMGWNGNPFGGMFGPGNASSTTSSSSSSTNNKKYNRLLNLVKQMVKADKIFTASQIDALNEAMRTAKGSADEKYEHLLEAYNSIPKDYVKEFLVEHGAKLGVSKEVKNNKDEDSFFNRLLAAGHEFTDIGADRNLDLFYDGIAKLKDSNATSNDVDGVVGELAIGTTNILDLISSWNNEYKSTSGSKRIIDHIKTSYNKMSDNDA